MKEEYFIKKEIIKENSSQYKLRKKYPKEIIELNKKYLKSIYPTLDVKHNETMRVVMYLYDGFKIDDIKCLNPNCNKIKKWNSNDSRFEYFCSKICKDSNKHLLLKKRKENLENNNIIKYGVKNVSNITWVKDKKSDTCFKNYGVKNPFQIPFLKHKFLNNQNKRSKIEIELGNYIKTLIPSEEIIFNDNHLGFELDIYIPKYNLAIEYNGLYWHSIGKNNYDKKSMFKNKHVAKTKQCFFKNIQLLQIFSNEDLDIWKSIIKNKLGLSTKIGARKTKVIEIAREESLEIIGDNHLQGNILCNQIYIALEYEGNYIACMTFGTPRYDKYDYELIRFVIKKGYNITGGASKMFKFFIKSYNPKSIISYANKRWSNGRVYEKLGFEFSGISQPNCFIIDNDKIKSRLSFQKHKLPKILEHFDKNLTADENLVNNNYRLIWDCGNLVYKWKKE